jgi:CHAT domain-containing protein
VQALLDDETTLLSYYVLDEKILSFVITASTFDVLELDLSREELAGRMRFLRATLHDGSAEPTRQAVQDLYRLLFAPLVDSIHTTRLIVVPHGALHYLPFAALQDPDTGQYLIERHALALLPSASVLPFVQSASEPAQGPALVLGDPITGEAGLSPLVFAEREAETIAALYGVQPRLGAAATERAVREQAGQASVLHLAAHAGYDPLHPLLSAIALAPDDEHDGRLEVQEVYGLDLAQADLVVLSACETQLGDLSAGDELVGLTRAFFFAGTPSVVATLWNADDAATAELMERFYVYLHEGKSKAGALRLAQLDVRAEHPHPYYWAGFVLSGDGGPPSQDGVVLSAPTPAPAPETTPPDASDPAWRSGLQGVPAWTWAALGAGVVVVLGLGVALMAGVGWALVRRRKRRR